MHSKADIQPSSLEPAGDPEPDATQSRRSGQVSCVICGSLVSLENCKLDEHGSPVHDHCYFDSLSGLNHSLQK
jgi:hypothetical protein